MKKKLLAAFIASSMSLTATAATLDPSAKKTVEDAIHKSAPDTKIIGQFDGPGDFVGLIIKGKDDPKPSVIWTTRDGKYLVAGNLIETNTQRNLTDVAAEHYKAANPINLFMTEVVEMTVKRILPKSAQLAALDAMKKSGTALDDEGLDQIKVSVSPDQAAEIAKSRTDAGGAVVLGDTSSDKTVYVFFDPRCPHCREFYQSVAEHIGKDGMKWVFIPVSFINEDSTHVARTLLEQGDKKAMDALIPDHPSVSGDTVKIDKTPNKKLDALVEENRKALSDILGGNLAVPMVVVSANNKAKAKIGLEYKEIVKFAQGENQDNKQKKEGGKK